MMSPELMAEKLLLLRAMMRIRLGDRYDQTMKDVSAMVRDIQRMSRRDDLQPLDIILDLTKAPGITTTDIDILLACGAEMSEGNYLTQEPT